MKKVASWIGKFLLTLSTIFWLIIIIGVLLWNPDDFWDGIIGCVALSIVPIILGIILVRYGRDTVIQLEEVIEPEIIELEGIEPGEEFRQSVQECLLKLAKTQYEQARTNLFKSCWCQTKEKRKEAEVKFGQALQKYLLEEERAKQRQRFLKSKAKREAKEQKEEEDISGTGRMVGPPGY